MPLLIPPIHTIENAHYSSIIDLEYLKISQLIVSSSTDGTIKFWDPISRPKKLTHGDGLALMKPGYYKKLAQEVSKGGESFREVRRIYTDMGGVQLGDNMEKNDSNNRCSYWLKALDMQARETGDWDGDLKFNISEFLISLELGGSNSAGSIGAARSSKNFGAITIYGMERLRIEVPVCRVEEPIPKQLMIEMEELAINNREAAKIMIKRKLPQILEKLNSRILIASRDEQKVASLLKGISLKRFSGEDSHQDIEQLFSILTHMSNRGMHESSKYLSINEIHMFLRKNGALFPRNIGKDAFLSIVKAMANQGSKYLIDQRTKNTNKLINYISSLIARNDGELGVVFKQENYTCVEFKRLLRTMPDS